MWYEILPTYLTITAFLAVPNLFVYYTNKLFLDQPYKRRLFTKEDDFNYLRDGRLSHRKWAYDFKGLENLPDLEEPRKEPHVAGASKC